MGGGRLDWYPVATVRFGLYKRLGLLFLFLHPSPFLVSLCGVEGPAGSVVYLLSARFGMLRKHTYLYTTVTAKISPSSMSPGFKGLAKPHRTDQYEVLLRTYCTARVWRSLPTLLYYMYSLRMRKLFPAELYNRFLKLTETMTSAPGI